jgi:iterative type I PKS product template protein
MESLLNLSSTIQWETYPHSIIDVSCHGNGITPKPNLRASLLAALNMIFRECMDWGKMVTDVTSRIQGSPSKIRVIPIASGGSQTLLRILKGNGIQLVELVKPVSDPMFNDEYNKTMYQTTSGCKIAIVGAACRFPSADNVHAFWDLLIQGRDVHKPVPPLRWSVDSHVDTSAKPMKNTSATPFGCWLDEPGLFDAGFFGMSPREAEQVDPAQRLALMTAYEALEDGGIVPGARSTQRDRVGVAFGVTSNDWMETNSAQNIDTYMIPGGNRAFIPGRINYAFKFSGPSYAIDTACSSSLAAIDIACKVLERGEVDTMIAGGSNIITNPDFTAGLDKGRFLSRTGNCKTFDDLADGYCRAEGVATVILKRLEDAILDGDSIKGVIVKACTNHSAEAESITRPYVQAQQQIFTKVLDGLSPAKISYVEMHGTGTQVGDATEMTSMLNVIAPNQGSQRRRPKEDVVHVGSVKANVGHGEAVAGVTSLIKLLMMMQHNTIPPHCGIKTVINRKFPTDLADRGVQIASRPTAWAKQDVRPRYALLNNFSAAGGNTTLLLEDGPTISLAASSMDSRLIFPITLSAKTPSALRANAESLLDFTLRKPDTDLQSLSYTTTARRMHHAYRIAICGSSLNEIASNLRSYLEIQTGKQRPIKHSVLFTFTGQGGHYMGMGRTLYHTNTFFKKTMDRYCDLASNQGFCDFLPLIKNLEGDISDFGADATQLAITCVQMALSKLWQSWGVVPSGVMGHSLGHYAALNTAGVLSEADTIFAVGIRAQLLHENCRPGTHSMLVVRANEREVQPFLDNYDVEVACVNSPLEVVLSGERTKIETCREALSMSRIRSMVLGIPYAFHSSQVDCVLKDFEVALRGVNFKAPRIPVICPRMRAVVRKERLFNPAHLVEHFRSSVNIVDAIEVAKRENFIGAHTQFLEIGHNANISAMLKANLGNCCNVYASIKKDMDNWASLTEAIKSLYMSGLDIRWDEFHRDYSSHLHVVELPSYNWDLKNYWIPYVNDWSLRKGEPAQIIESGTRPKLLSRTIHSVVREEVFNSQGTIVLRTDLSTPKLRVVAQGHKVKGLALCTPSLYADIALSVGRYIQSTHLGALFSKQISVDDMVVEKALIALHTTPQLLQTLVHINEDQKVRCEFSTVQEDGTILTRHASCVVIYGSNPTSEILRDQAVQINTAIQRMQEELMAGISYRFNSSMIYRMVATLADFDRGYRGLKEIILNSEAMTATGIVDLSILPKDAHSQPFTAHPAYVDSFSQLAGFVMNANEACDLEVECFVNHGWGSLVLYDDINEKGVYQVYVEMKKRENRIWQGTLVVLRDERVVAIFKDITVRLALIRFAEN